MASPSLGGVIDVPLEMCKKWELEMSDEIFSDPDFVLENFEEAREPENDVQIMDEDEQAQIGYFNVFKIVKHKFQQGWKFLVWWENFPISASTWEPISSFVHPNGSVNSVFKAYCLDNGLTNILQKALSDNPS